ncbi:uncharacterized protein BXZ73DRAFT_42295 [Epithele typhae]|uniref:uncharacterized protein n=1 Tax=Epithele typhae TaxID=378194 RepID=UPI0020089297|nr:uncharacterized protein BXZ73DRAFT_42295 [Epithele typhae]KAH9941205.1 hypothetical protein BXZ73DRAFT_42295 [Epithele typhae]
MHLLSLNVTALIVSILRGSLKCYEPDDKSQWRFSPFRDDSVWKAHGKLVGASTRYLPGSFDRPPRDPAEKISSGYKAWEYLLYVYGLLPGFLRINFPDRSPFYRHFCKLVLPARAALQHSIPHDQIAPMHQRFSEYVHEYEELYFEGRSERLHFVRPCLHTLCHIFQEVERTGPCTAYTQWTLENFIGNITRELKQHVTPYANLAERALRRCLINALKALYPHIFDPPRPLPNTALKVLDAPEGYILSHPRERNSRALTSELEREALRQYLVSVQEPLGPDFHAVVQRWARLYLPSGQIARTLWKEGKAEARGLQPRRARMLGSTMYAEVQFFFQMRLTGPQAGVATLAMISRFTAPDPRILAETLGAVLACTYRGSAALSVVPVRYIKSVVAMVPLPLTRMEEESRIDLSQRYFVVEKPGLEIAMLAGRVPSLSDSDEDLPIE